MSTNKLLTQLIQIPSYVDNQTNEILLASFLETYINQQFPWFQVTKQMLPNSNRFNLIVSDKTDPKLIFISHMDTVKPSTDTKTMLFPKITSSRVCGLGSADMKGGIAALFTAVKLFGPTRGLTLIFDCDEEYYFSGIKQVIKDFKFQPQLVVCPEPTDLKIVNGCRGLVEIDIKVSGKSAHASRLNQGINAITESSKLIKLLNQKLNITNSPLGPTTVNLSYLRGGTLSGNKIVNQPNTVPNYAQFTLDLRISQPQFNAKYIIQQITTLSQSLKLSIISTLTKLDYPAYITPKSELKPAIKAINTVLKQPIYQNPKLTGFYESAIVSRAWNSPAINFGPSGIYHCPNEYVTKSSLKTCTSIYQNLIKTYCN